MVFAPDTKTQMNWKFTKGHIPFHPDCEHCTKAKGVHQHRRKTDEGLVTEVAVDFMFLSCVGVKVRSSRCRSP